MGTVGFHHLHSLGPSALIVNLLLLLLLSTKGRLKTLPLPVMDDSTRQEKSSSLYTETSQRPYVTEFVKKPAFYVGDKVYLRSSTGPREGPYLIASISESGAFTLCHADGRVVRNGAEIEVDYLEAA